MSTDKLLGFLLGLMGLRVGGGTDGRLGARFCVFSGVASKDPVPLSSAAIRRVPCGDPVVVIVPIPASPFKWRSSDDCVGRDNFSQGKKYLRLYND